jgi:hypothetical protein
MDRRDRRISRVPELVDEVILEGTGRDAELIVAGLRTLLAQLTIRDTISGHGCSDYQYGTGRKFQGQGFALVGEVTDLLAQIENKNYIEEGEVSQEETQPTDEGADRTSS